MALTCADVRRLIDEEGSVTTTAARQHLAVCQQCREAVSRWHELAGQLQEWRDDAPPAFLHARLMAHLRAAGRERASRRPLLRRLWWASTLATAALVAVVIWRMPAQPPAEPLAEPASAGSPSTTPPSTEPPSAERPNSRPSSVEPPTLRPPVATPLAKPPGEAPPSESGPGSEGAPGPVRGVSESSRAKAMPVCELIGPDDGDTRRRVPLDEAWAPPRGVSWTIVVAPSGQVRPAPGPDLESITRPAVPLETLEALASLNLPAGRYVLQRAR
jgi:hypothetical protein